MKLKIKNYFATILFSILTICMPYSQTVAQNNCKLRIAIANLGNNSASNPDYGLPNQILNGLNGGTSVESKHLEKVNNERNSRERAESEGYDYLLMLSINTEPKGKSAGCYTPVWAGKKCYSKYKITINYTLETVGNGNRVLLTKSSFNEGSGNENSDFRTKRQQDIVKEILDAIDNLSSNSTKNTPTSNEILKRYSCISGWSSQNNPKTTIVKFDIESSSGIRVSVDLYTKKEKWRVDIRSKSEGVFSLGFNGNNGWGKRNGKIEILLPDDLEEQDNYSEVMRDVLSLSNEIARTTLVGTEKFGSRDVYIIEARMRDNSKERLYFDTQTGLLLRQIKEDKEILYEEYQKTNGVQLPFTIKLKDKNESYTLELISIELNGSLTDSIFNP